MNVFLFLLTRYISVYFSVPVCVVCGSGEAEGGGGVYVCTGGIGVDKGAKYFLLQCWKVPISVPDSSLRQGTGDSAW